MYCTTVQRASPYCVTALANEEGFSPACIARPFKEHRHIVALRWPTRRAFRLHVLHDRSNLALGVHYMHTLPTACTALGIILGFCIVPEVLHWGERQFPVAASLWVRLAVGWCLHWCIMRHAWEFMGSGGPPALVDMDRRACARRRNACRVPRANSPLPHPGTPADP